MEHRELEDYQKPSFLPWKPATHGRLLASLCLNIVYIDRDPLAEFVIEFFSLRGLLFL